LNPHNKHKPSLICTQSRTTYSITLRARQEGFQDATHEGSCGGDTASTGQEIIALRYIGLTKSVQLPHMHLVSKYRYPLINSITLDTVVGYLTEAPKIVHDLQPVQWQFLDAPHDGSVFLVWQPLEYLDTNFASDGYVWADVEQAFSQEIRGYVGRFPSDEACRG
jgi:hypothetical protein